MIFKVSVKVHRTSWHGKDRLNKAEVRSYVAMYLVFNTEAVNSGRDEYEGLGVAVSQ